MTFVPRFFSFRRVKSKVSPVLALKVYWVVAICWWEYGIFVWDVAWCRWPKENATKNLHILLIADPQVPRPFRGWLPTITWFKTYIINHNLRKSWHAAKSFRPQTVVFLGDMLRHGSKASDMDEYVHYANHFKTIFKGSSNMQKVYVPGNRDVGLGSSRTFSAQARSRYEAVFGKPNQINTFENYTMIFLDAPALVEEDYRRHSAGHEFSDWTGIHDGSIEFVNALASNFTETKTTILFTHIPLWRQDGASCGPLREYGSIRRGAGKGYQSLLGKETSNFLLNSLAPSAIFSADDHDYCHHIHKFPKENGSVVMIPEVTVKSLSMATNVHRPGFHLVTLQGNAQEVQQTSISSTPCLLPDQSRIYTQNYLLSLLVTTLVLLYFNIYRSKAERDILDWCSNQSPIGPNSPSPPNSPIRYKSSYSSPVLRSATALHPSEPPSPLGGTPLLRPPLSPYLQHDDKPSEGYTWPTTPTSPGTPSKVYPRVKDNSSGKDSSYFLPSVNSYPPTQKPFWFVAQTSLTNRRLTTRSVISAIFTCLWRASLNGHRKAKTWYGQFAQDLLQVLFFPSIIYSIISIWYCI